MYIWDPTFQKVLYPFFIILQKTKNSNTTFGYPIGHIVSNDNQLIEILRFTKDTVHFGIELT